MSVFLYALRGDTRPGYISGGGGRTEDRDHIYIYIHTYIHTYIHIYIYIYIYIYMAWTLRVYLAILVGFVSKLQQHHDDKDDDDCV